jgi:hypothetical protein
MVSTGEGTTTNSIKSLTARNVTKTSRMRYARHMIRRPEDLPHKKLYSEPNPMQGEIKEDREPGGRMG